MNTPLQKEKRKKKRNHKVEKTTIISQTELYIIKVFTDLFQKPQTFNNSKQK